MGLRPWEFYEYTWHEFSLAVSGYRTREKNGWYQTRKIMYAIIAASPNRPKNMPPENQIIDLDGDAGIDEEEKQEALAALRQAQQDNG